MLELTKRNIVELPFEVMELAYWRPQDFRLCEKHQKALPQNGKSPKYKEIFKLWRRRETIINASLDALLFALNPVELAGFGNSLCHIELRSAYIYKGYCKSLNDVIGVPDFIVGDDSTCLVGEMKVHGGQRYDFQQFIKYQCFAALCRVAESLPNNLFHLLIVPENAPEAFCSDFGKNWSPQCRQNKLEFKADEISSVLGSFKESLETLIKKPAVLKQKSLVDKLQREITDLNINSLAPTFVFSWNEFILCFDNWAKANHRNDLLDASGSLLNLCVKNI